MTQDFPVKIKSILESQKAQLEEQLSSMMGIEAEAEQAMADTSIKDDESAAELATMSDNLSLGKTLQATLRDVNNALKRLHEGTYGFCKHCSKPIDERRLLVRPESGSCVECKERLQGLR